MLREARMHAREALPASDASDARHAAVVLEHVSAQVVARLERDDLAAGPGAGETRGGVRGEMLFDRLRG
jgi:hypothetical protein